MDAVVTPPAGQEPTSQAFLEGMSRLAAAVHVVTTDGPAGRAGFTASAVCSVTDSPPMLLVCVNGRSSSLQTLLENGLLCVNTLAPEQRDAAQAFASGKPMAERFQVCEWEQVPGGAPRLAGCLVSFACEVVSHAEQGSHKVLFCAIREVIPGGLPPNNALVYFGRKYNEVRALP